MGKRITVLRPRFAGGGYAASVASLTLGIFFCLPRATRAELADTANVADRANGEPYSISFTSSALSSLGAAEPPWKARLRSYNFS